MEKKKTRKEIVKMLLKDSSETLENEEDLMDLLFGEHIAIDVDKEEEKTISKGDKIADKVTQICGSWGFIISFVLILISWIYVNYTLEKYSGVVKSFDPYPFILLNLVLSCIAALQAPIIMMSQNRAAKKDSLRGKNDYKTDLKSELLLEELHSQIDKLLQNQNKIIKLLEENEK